MAMTFSSQRWTSGARRLALAALLAGTACAAARAEPVDAVPLDRPGTRMDEPFTPPADPTPPATAPQADIGGTTFLEASAPNLGASPLAAPEPAIARIRFDADGTALSDMAKATLDAFADEFKRRGGRVALKAYAGNLGDTGINARRMSLKRVLAVREYLLARGIAAERLEVRALGGAHDSGPLDRVDITRPGG